MCVFAIGSAGRCLLAYWVLGLLALAAIFFSGCSANSCKIESPGEEVLKIWYSEGGPAPPITSIAISENGTMTINDSKGKFACAKLDPAEISKVKTLVNADGVAEAVATATGEGRGYYDYESLEMETEDWKGSVPIEVLPDELDGLLDQLDNLLKEHFKRPAPWRVDRQ